MALIEEKDTQIEERERIIDQSNHLLLELEAEVNDLKSQLSKKEEVIK